MAYDTESYYCGEIVAQSAGTTKNDELQVFLDVKLEGKLMDKYNPDGGMDPAPDATVQVRLNFRDNEDAMRILQQDLERLGFDGDDPVVLIPDQPNHHSFVGQRVFLQPKLSSANGKTSLFWNLRFPRRYQPKVNTEKIDIVTSAVRNLWKKARDKQAALAVAEEPPF